MNNNSLFNSSLKLAEFTNIALSVLDKYQARKRKNICAKRFCVHDKRSQSSNNAKVAIMQLPTIMQLRQKFLKERTSDSKHLYNRQRNLYVKLLQKNEKGLV